MLLLLDCRASTEHAHKLVISHLHIFHGGRAMGCHPRVHDDVVRIVQPCMVIFIN